MSAILSAVSAITASLQTAPAVSSAVYQVRLRPITAATTTAVVVRQTRVEAIEPSTMSGGVFRWDARVEVECYARAAAGASPDAALDALVSAVYARLMADQRLGGAAQFLLPNSIEYEFDIDGEATACAVLQFTVRLVTATQTL